MKLRREDPTRALSPDLQAILLNGPNEALGQTLWDLPPHEELRRLWAVHGAALKKRYPRRRLWFETREYWVRVVRGESQPTYYAHKKGQSSHDQST